MDADFYVAPDGSDRNPGTAGAAISRMLQSSWTNRANGIWTARRESSPIGRDPTKT
jgi:hypothetical protein